MEINLVAEGLKFMVLGMGVVFVFLALLVQMMKWQKLIISKYFPPEIPSGSAHIEQGDEKTHVAAIIAAVTEYRSHRSRR